MACLRTFADRCHNPSGLRSSASTAPRCLEVFFRNLSPEEIGVIADNAAKRIQFLILRPWRNQRFASNGRDAVNIVQIAAGVVTTDGRSSIAKADIEWVLNCGQYAPRPQSEIRQIPQ